MSGSIQSIERAAAVLQVLGAAGDALPLGELARRLDLPKPTVHGIVRTLVDVGFAAQEVDTGHYLLGPGLATLGQGLDPHLLRSRALTWADGLAARTGLEVQLGVPRGDALELLHHVFRPDRTSQRLRVDERQPLADTALGLVLLAFAPAAVRLPSGSAPAAPADPVALRRAVSRVRRQGWSCVDGGLAPGVAAVAAPVLHHGGVAVGALAVVGPSREVATAAGQPRSGLERQVVAAATAISATLQARL